jgi:hypothetical protein
MTWLESRLERAALGDGSAVTVSGPPGVGKSRLLAELQESAAQRGIAVRTTACDEFGAATPFATVGALLRRALDLDIDTPAAAAAEAVTDAVRGGTSELAPWLPLLAALVGAELAPTPEVEALEPRFVARRQSDALVELLGSLDAGPALWIVDDAQWADESSAAGIASLAAAAPGRGWMVVTAHRSDGEQAAGVADGAELLELGPLDAGATTMLARAASAGHPLSPHRREELCLRSGGNPLFLLELISAGDLLGSVTALPDSVESLLAARIDRLAPPQRRLLRVASVLGPVVEVPVEPSTPPSFPTSRPARRPRRCASPARPSGTRPTRACPSPTAGSCTGAWLASSSGGPARPQATRPASSPCTTASPATATTPGRGAGPPRARPGPCTPPCRKWTSWPGPSKTAPLSCAAGAPLPPTVATPAAPFPWRA